MGCGLLSKDLLRFFLNPAGNGLWPGPVKSRPDWPVARQNGPRTGPWAEVAARNPVWSGPAQPVAQRGPRRAGTVRPERATGGPGRPVVHL
jgi:hypothetical protein